MLKTSLAALAALGLLAVPASANCDTDFDAISKAISDPVTMEGGHRAAMMRLAVTGYDQCMSGDKQSAASLREMLMKQLRANLGDRQ